MLETLNKLKEAEETENKLKALLEQSKEDLKCLEETAGNREREMTKTLEERDGLLLSMIKEVDTLKGELKRVELSQKTEAAIAEQVSFLHANTHFCQWWICSLLSPTITPTLIKRPER